MILSGKIQQSHKNLEKMKEQQDKLNAYASMNTKNIQKKANISSGSITVKYLLTAIRSKRS